MLEQQKPIFSTVLDGLDRGGLEVESVSIGDTAQPINP
jgi:hypothetical protein